MFDKYEVKSYPDNLQIEESDSMNENEKSTLKSKKTYYMNANKFSDNSFQPECIIIRNNNNTAFYQSDSKNSYRDKKNLTQNTMEGGCNFTNRKKAGSLPPQNYLEEKFSYNYINEEDNKKIIKSNKISPSNHRVYVDVDPFLNEVNKDVPRRTIKSIQNQFDIERSENFKVLSYRPEDYESNNNYTDGKSKIIQIFKKQDVDELFFPSKRAQSPPSSARSSDKKQQQKLLSYQTPTLKFQSFFGSFTKSKHSKNSSQAKPNAKLKNQLEEFNIDKLIEIGDNYAKKYIPILSFGKKVKSIKNKMKRSNLDNNNFENTQKSCDKILNHIKDDRNENKNLIDITKIYEKKKKNIYKSNNNNNYKSNINHNINYDINDNINKNINPNRMSASKNIIYHGQIKRKRNFLQNTKSFNNNEQNKELVQKNENIKEDEKQDDEYISENNNFKYEISINENALQNDKDIYKNGVNNHNKIIEPFYKSIGENDIREDDKNEDEESINKNENIEEKYNCNENNQENIQNKNYLIVFKSNENAVQENQIKMYYNTNNIHKKKIQILGKNFVKKYNGKCHIIFKNKKYDDLTECFDVPVDGKNLEIFLESIDKITDASEMFADCDLLYKIDGISEWDTSNITNMSGMFMNCKSLESLEGLSNFNLVNCTNINYMFSGCRSLRLLPDISGWNTNNITNMFNLFENCESLSSLPDISKWNIKSVTNIKCIFSGCKSLETLPDLSKWNVNSVTDMSHLFEKCENLKILPEISEWDAKNVTNMEKMFYCCLKLEEIKIFKKVYKVENINYLYYGCKSLKKEPDLKGWNLNNIRNKKNFNSNCFHLKNKIKYNL